MKRDNHILIVSENAEFRAQLIADLSRKGVPTLEARNAAQGMTTLTQSYPALILLDALMVGMSGIQFCKQMIHYELTSVPVMIMFEASQKAAVIRDFSVLRLAKKGAIQKPFSADELLRQIEQMLGYLPQGTVNVAEPVKAAPGPIAPNSAPMPQSSGNVLKEVDELLTPRTKAPAAMVEKAPGLVVQTSLDHRKPTAAKPDPQPVLESKPSRKASKTGYRVLVIDDDADIRLFLKLALDDLYEVASAENGMVGLAIMEQFLPDIIVCDVMMPVMNGIETVEAVRKHPKFRETPVFFLTGEKNPRLPDATREAGGNLFLPKPIEPEKLLHYVDYFIRELDLKPRSREVTMAGHHLGSDGPVRILVIDSNPDNVATLRDLLADDTSGRWETAWSEEPRVALASLGRMEPDLILYNPRQSVMEGSAFGQFLSLKKQMDLCELAFIGKKFERDDIEYSRDHLGRDVVWLDVPTTELKNTIKSLVKEASKKFKAKKYSLDQLRAQETRAEAPRTAEGPAGPEELQRQRQALREQYKRIQRYIDQD